MNDSFRVVSDLVADAEDLLLKLGKSQIPEVRALKTKVQDSIDDMRDSLRRRIKGRANPGVGRYLVWGIGATLAVIAILFAVQQARSGLTED